LGMTYLPIEIQERYTKSESVGSARVSWHTPGQRRRARGETPVALRAPSVSPRSLRPSFIVVVFG
jgi:hypothetical protein